MDKNLNEIFIVRREADLSLMLSNFEGMFQLNTLDRYLEACSGNLVKAIRLYGWNTAAGAAFYGPLQRLEVSLRETFHVALKERFGENWYDQKALGLDSKAIDMIKECKLKLSKKRLSPSPSNLVSNLTFGFWVTLLTLGKKPGTSYEMSIWRPALQAYFVGLSRKEVYLEVNKMNRLRNSIAHHEPIFMRDLRDDYNTILKILGWISPESRDWVEKFSRVSEVLAERTSLNLLKF